MIFGTIVLALMAAPPATQTCPDGSVILATDDCAAPPPPPATQTCPDGSVILATEYCNGEVLAEMQCAANSVPSKRLGRDAVLRLKPDIFEVEFADGRTFSGAADPDSTDVWRSRLWGTGEPTPVAFDIADEPDSAGNFAVHLDGVPYSCKVSSS